MKGQCHSGKDFFFKIDTAPALSETSYAYDSGGIQPVVKSTNTRAVSKFG